ncbi:MAG TPA: hypothetical protein PLD25_18060 [Chloroflexota bacterium]|nr:hypothetical protein [Chloroflexota bacterium]
MGVDTAVGLIQPGQQLMAAASPVGARRLGLAWSDHQHVIPNRLALVVGETQMGRGNR